MKIPIEASIKGRMRKNAKLKVYQTNKKTKVIPEVEFTKEQDDDSFQKSCSKEMFDFEINLIHKYLSLEFKITDFTSQIIQDAFSRCGWVNSINSLQTLKKCHLLWLSRNSSHIYNNDRVLSKIHIVNKIANMNDLVQPSIFKTNLDTFLAEFKQLYRNIEKSETEELKNFYLEFYTIPNEIDEFQSCVNNEAIQEDTEFYWYFTNGEYKGEYEKITQSVIAPEFLSRSELFPCYIYRVPRHPLIIFGLNCTVSMFVLVNSINKLDLKVFNNAFIKLIQGPYFTENSKVTRARMMFSDLIELLKQRNYDKKKIENLWDNL